jgi:hypothetical protein
MRPLSDLDSRDLAEVVRPKHLHLVQSADRDIGELAVGIAHDVDVVRNRTCVERPEH